MTPRSRVRRKKAGHIACPVCAGRVVIPDVNSFAALNEDLLPEWDYERNEVDPWEIPENYERPVNLNCNLGHSYSMTPMKRVQCKKTGHIACPICARRANSFAALNEDLLPEWDYEKNEVDPWEIAENYNRPVELKCSLGHSYSMTPRSRVQCKKAGNIACPICARRANSFAARQEDLMKYWFYKYNNYLNVNPNHVTENDTSVVFWECENNDDHIYEMAINARVENKMRGIESCPICRGRRRKKMHYVKKSAKKS